MENSQVIPYIKITANSIVCYQQREFFGARPRLKKLKLPNNNKPICIEKFSTRSRSLIKNRLKTYFHALSIVGYKYMKKHKICPTFLTLTLSSTQIHSDLEIKRKCLMPFLQELQRKIECIIYQWVQEKQQNGNIHFHIICDRYIDHKWLRETWNKHQQTLSYIDNFELRYNHRNPNSTDIEKIDYMNKAIQYLSKYISKTDSKEKTQGRLHGCSDALKNFEPIKMVVDSELYKFIELAQDYCTFKPIIDEQFQFIPCEVPRLLELMPKYYSELFKEYHLKLLYYTYGT